LQRFREYKFDTLFATFNELADETQWHQFASLKHEIESIRMEQSIQGYVITGITDVHWEVNGLLDMWRNEKVHAKEMSLLQTSDLVMCRMKSCNYFSGEAISVEPLISHYSDLNLDGAEIRWFASGQTGVIQIPKLLEQGRVVALPTFTVTMDEVSRPKVERLQFQVLDRHGYRISENTYDMFIFPKRVAAPEVRLAFSKPLSASPLKSRLQKNEYAIDVEGAKGSILIASSYDGDVATRLSEGGTALMLIDSEEGLPPEWGIVVKARTGSDLDGRWVSNHNWIRTNVPPFLELGFSRILGFEAKEVIPEFVLQDVPPSAYQDVLSGITYGWLNKNAALTVQVGVGAGRLIMTTFRFDSYGLDPYATYLLDLFIQYLRSSDFHPTLYFPLVAAPVLR